MRIVSVTGARPEFIQAMPVSQALHGRHHEYLVHTGQHYDYEMSQTFFDQLPIPTPDCFLEVGSGTHGRQTADILVRLEEVLLREGPDIVVIRGDTNSTLAGALAASKLHIPIAHIEAGERSYDRRMPEEVNRLVADCLTSVYFCASQRAVQRLSAEGITTNVHWVGDVMLDALQQSLPVARNHSNILRSLEIKPEGYSLVTVHRAANTDNLQRLKQIVAALNKLPETIVFPVHPRTKKALEAIDAQFAAHVRVIDPVGYYDMLILEENARLIATDSGGVQREAYFLGIPCLTLRDETEWVETVEVGWNRLVGSSTDAILNAWFAFEPPSDHPPIFGQGDAARRIVEILDYAIASRRENRPNVYMAMPGFSPKEIEP